MTTIAWILLALGVGLGVVLAVAWFVDRTNKAKEIETLKAEVVARKKHADAVVETSQRDRARLFKLLSASQDDRESLKIQVTSLEFELSRERSAYQAELNELRTDRQLFKTNAEELAQRLTREENEVKRLMPWSGYADAADRASELLRSAQQTLSDAENQARVQLDAAEAQFRDRLAEAAIDAEAMTDEASAKLRAARAEAEHIISSAFSRSEEIMLGARTRANEIAGKAFDAVRNAEFYERTVLAMKNIIEGYGDEYLKPTDSLLDELAADFSHQDAGRELKRVRDHIKLMVKQGKASTCDYVEANRREMAERFVLDAFNGKVDSILSMVKHDNYGKLEQEIRDAFVLVNFNGKAFRDARINEEYLALCLEEVRWASRVHELRRREQEEQRQIREQIREEEKARRDIARALKEAEREEQIVRKAMAAAEAKIAAATAEQRAGYENEFELLRSRLQEAEDRGQRALSMAQQTKRGHVYIISNLGSFGDGIYKIGLTRRLEPLDRVKELGDASVPFEFDVHAIILSDDAPALENRLHKLFILNQINKVNHRKEFFRADIADLRREIEALGIEAKWTMAAEAAQYRESLAIDRAIESDPAAREAWLNRQLTLDPVDYLELVGNGEQE